MLRLGLMGVEYIAIIGFLLLALNLAGSLSLTSPGGGADTPIVCGDSTCNGDETCESCSSDCGLCPGINICGNGLCSVEETALNCPQDCGSQSPCGNGRCDSSETHSSCPQDCPSVCGDTICDGGETCQTCTNDCGSCSPLCGNGNCEVGEKSSTCWQDCGSACGDGVCNGGELCSTCVKDCGECKTISPSIEIIPVIGERFIPPVITVQTADKTRLQVGTKVKGTTHVFGTLTTEQEIQIEIESVKQMSLVVSPQRDLKEVTIITIEGSESERLLTEKTFSVRVYDQVEMSTNYPGDIIASWVFSVPVSWLEENAVDKNDISAARIADGKITLVPTTLSNEDSFTLTYTAPVTHFSPWIVIDAKNIVKGPGCNNDGVCDPTESYVLCPGDCIQQSPSDKCTSGEAFCVGDVPYRCEAGQFLKGDACPNGCDSGTCRGSPPSQVPNIINIVLIGVTIVAGMVVLFIFLRR